MFYNIRVPSATLHKTVQVGDTLTSFSSLASFHLLKLLQNPPQL